MSRTTILVVEDDDSILAGLVLNLETEGYDVVSARSGEDAVSSFERNHPDLILLDLMLPGMDGFEVLSQVRANDKGVPVIVLSARETQVDKVQGLDLGADDYITKPFALPELLARIKAALRRRPATKAIRFGAIRIDLSARLVYRSGEMVELTTREYDVLVLLAQSRGRVLTRGQIVESVWGPDYEGTERTVDNFIARLRTKLERDAENPEHLQTVRGVGYRLNP